MSELDAIYKKLNTNDKKILSVIFWHQRGNPKGIRSNALRRETPIKVSMNKNACYRHIKNMLTIGIIERDKSYSDGGQKQVFYHIKQNYFDIMCKESDNVDYFLYKRETELFIKSIQHYDSDKYVGAVMDFLSGKLILVAINILLQEKEEIRDIYYYDIWDKITDLCDSIRVKTLNNKENKKNAYAALLKMLEPYSSSSVGKRLMWDKIYNGLKEVQFHLD